MDSQQAICGNLILALVRCMGGSSWQLPDNGPDSMWTIHGIMPLFNSFTFASMCILWRCSLHIKWLKDSRSWPRPTGKIVLKPLSTTECMWRSRLISNAKQGLHTVDHWQVYYMFESRWCLGDFSTALDMVWETILMQTKKKKRRLREKARLYAKGEPNANVHREEFTCVM